MKYILCALSILALAPAELSFAKPGIPDSLSQLIEAAYASNPSLQAMQTGAAAQKEMAIEESALMDPMIGISQNNMPAQKRYWMVGQKFEFPTAYRLRRDAAEVAAKMESLDADQYRLELRAQIISTWFELQSIYKIKTLSRSDLDNLKELSRSAESKYAAGSASMQDFMRAHLMQTEMESDLIELEREEIEVKARLANLIGKAPSDLTVSEERTLAPPTIKSDPAETTALGSSQSAAPGLKARAAEVESAVIGKQIAKWKYAPDVTVKYQQSFPGEAETERMVSLELTVPLWFNGKSAGNRAAALNQLKKEYNFTAATRSLEAQVATLQAKSQSHLRLLTIIQSSMIPQATTSFEAFHSAYKANKTSFNDLLEAERTLLKVQINYWRTLSRYVESTSQLEAALGHSITDYSL